jgi:cyclopropane-fatty-acyl-phospholipid synthase
VVFDRILEKALNRTVLGGTLTVHLANNRSFTVGDGGAPRSSVRFHDTGAVRELVADPELALGELYMDGRLTIEEGDLMTFFAVLLGTTHGAPPLRILRLREKIRTLGRRLSEANSLGRARRNVAHHYDLDDRLYALFLDADRQYSCAYYETPETTLDEAQRAKKRHIAAKLLAEPGQRVLDIGCGWGGLGLYLAEVAGCQDVRGITLSKEQLGVARARAAEHGVADRVRFALEDYRDTRGTFDRIVSVGMFEHVGTPYYDTFFRTVRERLADDGVVLLHTIGRTGTPYPTNPWVTRYIFPGGHLPTMSELAPSIERSGLMLTDVEVLRLHYADTLRDWRARFEARREEAEALYDARFFRMWSFYLAMSEAAFRYEDVVVFQLQLTRRNDVVPTTRGYIAAREAALREAEAVLDARDIGLAARTAAE